MSYSDRHYGAGDPDCQICHGVGYVSRDVPEDHPDFGRALDCECRKAKVDEERRDYLLRLSGLNYFADKTLDTFDTALVGLHPETRANIQRAQDTAVAFAREPQGWLVIKGGYGCGKTHLAAGIANAQIAAGRKVIFMTVPDLLDYLRASFGQDSDSEGYEQRFDEVRNAPMLILDDLGIESPTAWAYEKLFQLLNHRYNTRLPTVITTNHDLEELEFRLRSRMFDPDISQIVIMTAPDYRRASLHSGQSDLNGLSLYAHMTFESFKKRKDLSEEFRINNQEAAERARLFPDESPRWLVLLGEHGVGKTHLAAAIANSCAARGMNVLFVTVPDLLDHLRAAYSPNSNSSYDRRFGEVKSASVLVLDDLGTESATPWAREKLYQLFTHRYHAQLPTVITSAVELEKHEPGLAARMRDKRLCQVFTLRGTAYRGEREPARK